MAYRLETNNATKKVELIIDGWGKGTAADPYSGINGMFQVDLETPGEVAAGYPITTSTVSGATLNKPCARSTRLFPTYGSAGGGQPDGVIQSWAIVDQLGHVFEATSVNGTWAYLASNNTVLGSPDPYIGLAYWLGYLFKFQGNKVYYWNGSTWTDWSKTIGSGIPHYAYVGTDNVLYFCNGNYLGSIVAGTPAAFDPTNSGTYTFTAGTSSGILQLPVTDICVSLAEVGTGSSGNSNLLIGGALNQIYPWDKISSSFGLPINVADSYIARMISVNQNALIFTGKNTGRGRIYITNGAQADLYFKIPDYIFGEQDPYYTWGDAIFHNNNIVFGFFITENSQSALIQNFAYVWAINLDTKAFRAISSIPLSSTFVANATCLLRAPDSGSGFNYIIAWDDNSTSPGIGYSGTAAGTSSSGATILTDLIPVGTFIQKMTFSQVEFKLRTPLKSGETITVSAFIDNVSLKSPLTFSPTPTTGSISGVAPVNFESNQWLQFVIDLEGNSSSSGCRLMEIRLR